MWRDDILRRRINATAHNTNLSHFHQASERKRGREATYELFHPYKRPKTEESQLSCEDRQNRSSVGSGDLNRVPENRSARSILESIVLEWEQQRNLLDWYKRTVTVDADDKKRSVAVVCHTLRTIMDNVRSQDGGYFYSANLLKAGSYAVKTKIGKADEFDWLLPLNATAQTHNLRRFSISIIKVAGSSGHYIHSRQRLIRVPVCHTSSPWTTPTAVQSQYIDTCVYNVPAAVVRNGEIVPRLLKNDLHAKIETAIIATGLGKRGVFLSPELHHGPALKLTIVQPWDHNISVDITPSLPTDLPVSTHGWFCSTIIPTLSLLKLYDLPKEERTKEVIRAGTHFVPKEDEAFNLSYSKAETALYKRLDGPNECRKMCHKVVKKLVQKFTSQSPIGAPGISSYIFKHQLLNMDKRIRNPGAWDQSNFRERLLEMLTDCAVVLRSGVLKNYFNYRENILAGKDRVVLNRLADHFLAERANIMNM